MPEPGVQKLTVTSNTAVQIKSGRTILRRIIVASPGTSWVVTVLDQDGASGGSTLAVFRPDGMRTLQCDLVLQQGLRVSGSGTAGSAIFVFE